MELKLEPQDGFLLATATGQVSLNAVLELHRKICDAATKGKFNKILYDCSAITGALSVMEEYEIAKTIAAYCVSKSVNPKVAVIGKPPTVTGFAARGCYESRVNGLDVFRTATSIGLVKQIRFKGYPDVSVSAAVPEPAINPAPGCVPPMYSTGNHSSVQVESILVQ